jgi:hypothetical protein
VTSWRACNFRLVSFLYPHCSIRCLIQSSPKSGDGLLHNIDMNYHRFPKQRSTRNPLDTFFLKRKCPKKTFKIVRPIPGRDLVPIESERITHDSLSTHLAVSFGGDTSYRAWRNVPVHRNLTPSSESSLHTPPTILRTRTSPRTPTERNSLWHSSPGEAR